MKSLRNSKLRRKKREKMLKPSEKIRRKKD
jgi:hypothetical protein